MDIMVNISLIISFIPLGFVIGGLLFSLMGLIIGIPFCFIFDSLRFININTISDFYFYVLLTTAVGILTGIGAVIGFNLSILGCLAVTGIPLVVGLIRPPLKLRKLKAQYRQQESPNLIEP